MQARQWAALAASLLTYTVRFGRQVFAQGAFRWPLPPVLWVAWSLALLAGSVFWVSLSAVRHSLALQAAALGVDALLSWTVLVLVVNGGPRRPTRQQLVSLAFSTLLNASFLLQTRLVLAD